MLIISVDKIFIIFATLNDYEHDNANDYKHYNATL